MNIPVAVAAVVVMVGGGCASKPAANLAAAEHAHAAPAASANAIKPPLYVKPTAPAVDQGNPHVEFASAPSISSSAANSSPQISESNKSRAALIGLYGELTGPNGHVGSPFDGGSNLAQITTAIEGLCVDPDLDRSATWLAFASTMHRPAADIYIKSVNGKTVTQLTADPADDVMPAFSPNGKTIAFASNRSGNWDIYTMAIDGAGSSQTTQLTNDPDHELHPSFSPDGRMIVYGKFGSQSGRWEMWVVDAANPAVRHFLDYGVFPQWCPDPARSKILFQRAKQRGSRDYAIWTIDFVNGQASQPTEIVSAANAALINPAWSPDGSRIVFVSVIDPHQQPDVRPGQSDLWVVNLDGTTRVSLTNGQFANYQPVWAGDGAVYFVSDRSGVDNIWAIKAPPTGMNDSIAPGGANLAGASSHAVDAASHP